MKKEDDIEQTPDEIKALEESEVLKREELAAKKENECMELVTVLEKKSKTMQHVQIINYLIENPPVYARSGLLKVSNFEFFNKFRKDTQICLLSKLVRWINQNSRNTFWISHIPVSQPLTNISRDQ